MQKMHNSVQNYAWGSIDALTTLYGVNNPEGKPMAELWMGAHPKSSSFVTNQQGNEVSLRDEISQDLNRYLGSKVAHRFGELPFLFKVLCVEQPLSVQVHPSKKAAEIGFAKENALGIPIDAAERNYKDSNHKPELLYALTPFQAMNGFRELVDTASVLQPVSDAHPDIATFLAHPDVNNLRTLFANLLRMENQNKTRAFKILKSALNNQQGQPWDTIRNIAVHYPDDNGLFSPLLFNIITLQPGEAMFLHEETPHAYLNGVALEVMANSDNVLRAGLTPKHIDIPELLANLKFTAKDTDSLLTTPITQGDEQRFPVPVEDFAFSIHRLSEQSQILAQTSAAIVFCIEGLAMLEKNHQQVMLNPGESCYLSADESPVSVIGSGRIARVFNSL